MKKNKIIILLFISFILILFQGCINTEVEKEKENGNNNDYKDKILGTWTKNDTYNNKTYVIRYEFYSNNSFISGVLNDDLKTYNISIKGTYIINNETLKFIVNGENPSNSTNKYIITSNNLLIYHEDGVNFDVYKKNNN
jgi:hypothetical protein